jgi:hypothetical protein
MSDNTEIRNKESLGGLITEQNADGSPLQEVIKDGETKAEKFLIRNLSVDL